MTVQYVLCMYLHRHSLKKPIPIVQREAAVFYCPLSCQTGIHKTLDDFDFGSVVHSSIRYPSRITCSCFLKNFFIFNLIIITVCSAIGLSISSGCLTDAASGIFLLKKTHHKNVWFCVEQNKWKKTEINLQKAFYRIGSTLCPTRKKCKNMFWG